MNRSKFSKYKYFLSSLALIGFTAPAAITISSCSKQNYDISKIDFNAFPHSPTLFLYPKSEGQNDIDPRKLTVDQVRDAINNNETIKQDLIQEICDINPKLIDSISIDDIDLSVDLSTVPEGETIDLSNPSEFSYQINVFPSKNSKHLTGSTSIPSDTYAAQAFPEDFEIKPSTDDYEKFSNDFQVDLAQPIYINNLFSNDKKILYNQLYDKLTNYQINDQRNNNEPTTVSKFIQQYLSEFVLEKLNKDYPDYGYESAPLAWEYDIKFSFDILQIDKLYHTKENPINLACSVLISDKIHNSYRSIPFIFKNVQIIGDKFDLSLLGNYDENNFLTADFEYYISNLEKSRNRINTEDYLRNELTDELNDRIASIINKLPIISDVPIKEWYVLDLTIPSEITLPTGITQMFEITIKPENRVNSPFVNEFTFSIPLSVKDSRKDLDDSQLINDLNTELSIKTCYVDVDNPAAAEVGEIKDGVSNSSTISSTVISFLKTKYSSLEFTKSDIEINFYQDGTHDVKRGDYASTSGGKDVYFILKASDSSRVLEKSTDLISDQFLKIKVVASDSDQDLSSLTSEYKEFGSTSSPLNTLTSKEFPDLTKVPKTEIQKLLDKNGEWNEMFLKKLITAVPAVNNNDYSIVVDGNDTIDLSNSTNTITATVTAVDSPLTGECQITFVALSPSQKKCDISSIDDTYNSSFEIPVYDPKKVSSGEIKNVVTSSTNIVSISQKITEKISDLTGVNAEYNVDFTIEFALDTSKTYELSEDSTKPTTLSVLKVKAISTSKKLSGEYLLELNLYSKKSSDQIVNYNLSIKPLKDNKEISTRFDYHVSGSKCGAKLEIHDLQTEFSYSKQKLWEKYQSSADYKNKSVSLKQLVQDGIVQSAIGRITGSWDCWCISVHSDFHDLNSLQIVLDKDNLNQHFERDCHANGTNVGFYSGDNRNNTNDDYFSAFRFIISFEGGQTGDATKIQLKFGYKADDKVTTLRWGCRGMSNMYDHSNNRYDAEVSSTASSETWN